MIQGCDYAFSTPNPAELYAAGLRFAMRYIGDGTDDKHLHAGERDALWSAGLSICLLCEGTEAEALAGFAKGVEQAHQSLADMAQLGVPAGIPVYFAADTDLVTAGQFAAIGEFCRGAASVLGPERVGMYGEYDCMAYLAEHYSAYCRWFFQTYAWSAGRVFAGNHVYQYHNGQPVAGGEVDLCRAMQSNFGQWEADMATPEEIADAVWNRHIGAPSLNYEAPSAEFLKYTVQNSRDIAELRGKVDQILTLLQGGSAGLAPHTHEVGQTGPAEPAAG